MSGDVIVTVTLNAALHVDYTTGDLAAEGINAVSRPSYRAGGRGVTWPGCCGPLGTTCSPPAWRVARPAS